MTGGRRPQGWNRKLLILSLPFPFFLINSLLLRADINRDLNLPQISNLALQQQNEQQQSANISASRSQNAPYNTRSTMTPMPAPVPTRAPVVPPPAIQPTGMWSPDMGIKFGSVGAAVGAGEKGANDTRPGPWDPSAGVRFG